MLTRKQSELLRFIDGRMKQGVTPSFDEMKDAMAMRSKSGIHRLVSSLEERGYLRRLPNRARAMEVVKLPGSPEGDLPAVGTVAVPLMGRIAAGTPIAALQERLRDVAVPPDMLGPGEHYALEVRGDSMKEAGIMDGDVALIRRTDHATTGEIVVALVDGEEATLKRYRRRGSSIALEPANPDYEVRILPEARVRVQGRLVGVWRSY